MHIPQIAAIVLAAGRSSRMGTHKLLLPLGDTVVVAHVVSAALGAPVRPVIVVMGHGAASVRAALPAGDYMLIENPLFVEGLSTSLRAGIAALPATVAGAVVLLGDQPLITADDVSQVVRVASDTHAAIVAATYAGRRGHPVYFSRTCFAELQQVTGDEGGRTVIRRYDAQVVSVPIANDSAGLDVDEPGDYARVLAIWARMHPR